MILPYPLYELFLHYILAGSLIIYLYINFSPLLCVRDMINDLLIIVYIVILRH